LAGLAAGSDGAGWVEWFQTRVAKCNNAQAAAVARAQIASPTFRAELQRLPTYWIRQATPT
jgi:hypothetical protein